MDKLPNYQTLDSEVMSHLRHALMNPLTVVVGYAQLLAARRDLPDDVRNQVTRIAEEARECVRILEQTRRTPRAVEADPEVVPQGGYSRRILVVDDEPVILKLTAEVLGGDYDVTGTTSADEALRKMLTDDFDIVLLDLNLGGRINGQQLYETLEIQHPDMVDRLVFVTGGALKAEEQDFLARSGRPCLRKPFSIKAMRDLVKRMAG